MKNRKGLEDVWKILQLPCSQSQCPLNWERALESIRNSSFILEELGRNRIEKRELHSCILTLANSLSALKNKSRQHLTDSIKQSEKQFSTLCFLKRVEEETFSTANCKIHSHYSCRKQLKEEANRGFSPLVIHDLHLSQLSAGTTRGEIVVETITNSQYVWLTLIKILHGWEIIMHHAKEANPSFVLLSWVFSRDEEGNVLSLLLHPLFGF